MSNIDKVIDYAVSFSKKARDIDPKLAFAIAKSDHEDGTTSLYLFGKGEGSDLTAIKMAEDSIPKLGVNIISIKKTTYDSPIMEDDVIFNYEVEVVMDNTVVPEGYKLSELGEKIAGGGDEGTVRSTPTGNKVVGSKYSVTYYDYEPEMVKENAEPQPIVDKLVELLKGNEHSIVQMSNSNTTKDNVSIKTIHVYFDLETDDNGIILDSGASKVSDVAATILNDSHEVMSLSYTIYRDRIQGIPNHDTAYNVDLEAIVSNDDSHTYVNKLSKLHNRGGVTDSGVQYTYTEYDTESYGEPTKGDDKPVKEDYEQFDVPVSDTATVTPEPKPDTTYKIADSMVVHISDTDTVTFTGDEVSSIFYANGSVILTSVSELALQHLAKDQLVELFTTGAGESGVVNTGYISEIKTGENVTVITLVDELPDSDKETSPIESYAKGEPGVEGKPVHLSSEGTIQGKTIQLGNTSISFGDKTARITADKIILEGVTIVQEPHNGADNNSKDMSGTHTLGELFEGLESK